MGAELIIDVMELPLGTLNVPEVEATRILMLSRIPTLDNEVLEGVLEQWTGDTPETWEMYNDGYWAPAVRERLTEAVNNLFGEDPRRDSQFWLIGGSDSPFGKSATQPVWVLISGGTSWGDVTESFDDSCLIRIANLNAPFKLSKSGL